LKGGGNQDCIMKFVNEITLKGGGQNKIDITIQFSVSLLKFGGFKMKKLCLLFLFGMVSVLFAQDHLLVTEFVVTPTDGEFIEI